MPAPTVLQTGVRVLFVGLLGTAWWLDRSFTRGGTAPLEERGSGAEAGASALERFGFRLHQVQEQAGVRFVHAQVKLDPQLANVEPHVAAMGAAVSVAD